MATVFQLPTLTAWANGGTMPTGQDAFGAYLDTDGLTCWLFQDFKSGFARVNLGTNTIIFQGNLFNVAGGTGLDSRYDGTPLFLQDDAGHYYWQQGGTLYKMHVAPSGVGTIGNGYLTVDATLASQPTNITRWYLFKTPINNTRYIITMTGDTPNGVAHVINADTMTAVGTFSPPQVPGAGNPDTSKTGASVGAYMDNSGNFSLWFSDPTLSADNVCNVYWNPNMGVVGGVLTVTQPEPNFHLVLTSNPATYGYGINWVAFLPSHNYAVVSNNEDFTSAIGLIDMTPLPAVALGGAFSGDTRQLSCWVFDAPTSAYDQGPNNAKGIMAFPSDIASSTTSGSTVQVGGILNVIDVTNSSLSLVAQYNITQLINLSPNVTNKVPPDVTTGRGNQAVTSVSADGVHATYICNNSFTVGQAVTTVQCTPAIFNVDNVIITAASPTQFSIALATTQASTPQGGSAAASVTFAPLGCVRYSAVRNAVLVTYEYVGSPAYWVILTGPPPVIQGNFQDLEGNPLANGYVTFKLTADASIAGVGQIGAGTVTTVPLDATGNATGQQGIWPNDQMVPTDTQYVMTAYSAAGQPVWQKTAVIPSSPTPFPLQNLQ